MTLVAPAKGFVVFADFDLLGDGAGLGSAEAGFLRSRSVMDVDGGKLAVRAEVARCCAEPASIRDKIAVVRSIQGSVTRG